MFIVVDVKVILKTSVGVIVASKGYILLLSEESPLTNKLI